MIYRNYKYFGDMSGNKVPSNLHLWQETPSGVYFVDSSDPTKLLFTADSGATISQIGSYGEAVRLMCRDDVNARMWIVEDDYDRAYYFDLTDSSDTGTAAGRVNNAYGMQDLWKIGSDMYRYDQMGVGLPAQARLCIVRYPGSDDWWTCDVEQDMGLTSKGWRRMSYVTEVGTGGYFLWNWEDENAELWVFESGANTITQLIDCGAGTSLPSAKSQRVITYDGSDKLGFILTTGGENYYYEYSISEDSITQGGKKDVYLMLNRSAASDTLEKGYDTNNNIYRINNQNYNHLFTISNIEGAAISGLSDNFAVLEDGKLYKYQDISDDLIQPIVSHDVQSIPTADIYINNSGSQYSFADNQTIELEDDNGIVFQGAIDKLDYNLVQHLECTAYSQELKNVFPLGEYTDYTVSGVLTEQIDGYCNYCSAEQITGSDLTGDYTYDGQVSLFRNLNRGAAQDFTQWYLNPTGGVYMDAGSYTGSITGVNQASGCVYGVEAVDVNKQVNYVKVYGGYISGVQQTGIAEDEAGQELNGIIPLSKSYANVTEAATLAALASGILQREQSVPIKVQCKIANQGWLQPGHTIGFGFKVTGMREIPSGNYIVVANDYEARADINNVVLTNGVIDIQDAGSVFEEHSQQINQLADYSQTLSGNTADNSGAIQSVINFENFYIGHRTAYYGTGIADVETRTGAIGTHASDEVSIPGYFVCNGESGTPDYIGRFASFSGIVGATGGEAEVTLTEAQMPSHNHNVGRLSQMRYGSDERIVYAGSSTYPVSTSSAGSDEAHENRPPFITEVPIIKME